MDPADGDADPRGAARLRRPGQLPRHRRRARHPRVPRPAGRASSSCSPIPTASPSRRSASTQLPAFVFIRVDGTVAGRRRGLDRGVVAGRRRRDRRGDGVALAGHPASSATPARSTGRPRSADRAVPSRAPRPARSSRSSTSCAPPSLTPGGPSWPRRPAPARRPSCRWPLLDEPWLGRPADRDARAAPPGDPRRGAADGRPDRRRPSATSSATRPATSGASVRPPASRCSPRAC